MHNQLLIYFKVHTEKASKDKYIKQIQYEMGINKVRAMYILKPQISKSMIETQY